ncbi:DUF3052 domain-containing protein [Actinomycetaceae bacterium MB13-C1-2]|nr:DUF3052 domain-containing protein [Actinomycetaceae bacterium MB13-C1-2]
MGVNLGFSQGQVVQELYYDDDVDQELRTRIETLTGAELVDYDYGDMVDGVVLWWRADDAEEEDLVDVLVDAAANLDDAGGIIWVLSPKAGRAQSVHAGDIEESAKTAGLKATSATAVGADWAGMRLVASPRK